MFQLFPANDAPAKHPPVVRVCGRPNNIVPETASFSIDVNQWVGLQNQKALFLWSGTIPEAWAIKPMPNPNSPKFISVTGILAGTRVAGTSKRFHVDISSLTFLGSAPLAYTTQGKHSNSRTTFKTDFPHSVNPNPQGKAEGGDILRGQAHSNQESLHLITKDDFVL